MLFGLKNAGTTYQSYMLKCFRGLIGRTVEAYVDDIIVDVLPPIACHGGTRGSMFGLRRMLNSMVNARDSRFILVQALDR